MSKTVRNLALFGGTIIVLSFVVFVVNQTARVVQLASAFDPRAGQVVLAGLVGTYAVLVAVPVFMVIRLPRPLVPPESRDGPEYLAHLERLRARLRLNPYHAIKNLEGEAACCKVGLAPPERSSRFRCAVFPPLAKGGLGGWSRHDQSQGLPHCLFHFGG